LATLIQASIRSKIYKKINLSRTPALKKNPQLKGVVTKVTTMSPKKPNSAVRHIAKINLTNSFKVTARIPGAGYLCSKYNRVLVHGGRANDLPGVGYTLVRGVYDFIPMIGKRRRRSIYGTSRPEGLTKYLRKSLRTV
jgi:small subunit ribosomal protein S12